MRPGARHRLQFARLPFSSVPTRSRVVPSPGTMNKSTSFQGPLIGVETAPCSVACQ